MRPMHVAPNRGMRIVLEEHMILAFPEDRSIRIVHPVGGGHQVKLRTVRIVRQISRRERRSSQHRGNSCSSASLNKSSARDLFHIGKSIARHGRRYSQCMSAPVIREASEDDLPKILELYASAEIIGEESFTFEEARHQLRMFKRYPSYRVFVAVLDDAIVGTYELLIMDNLAKRGKKSGVVEDVAVHSAFRGRGIGRAMMEHAREQCRQ